MGTPDSSSFLNGVVRGVVFRSRMLFNQETSGLMILLSSLVGAISGCVAYAFVLALDWCTRLIQSGMMHYVPPSAGSDAATHAPQLDLVTWVVLLAPAVGGLLSGLLVFTFCPEAEGHGSDAMIRSFHRLQGAVRSRVPFIKALASIITISSGGSAGREGPIAQIGAGVGAILAARLKLSADFRRHLMLSGAAGGIAAVFQAPLGAALFVCEVLYASTAIETPSLLFAAVSAVTSYAVFIGLHGQSHEIIVVKALAFHGLADLPFFVVFSGVCALAGFVYVRTFYGLRDLFFRKLPIPHMLKPALGGLLLGVCVLALRIPPQFATGMPHVMSGGYGWIQQALDGTLQLWWALGILTVVKMLSTSLTISSGGSGGVFAPSLFIGAMLGGAFGQVCQIWFPGTAPSPQAFVLVGMGGFFAGVAKVPITAVVMVSEMTGNFALVVPLLFVGLLTNAILSRRVSLYEEQVAAPLDSPAHQGDFVVDVLAQLQVKQVFDASRPVTAINQKTSLKEVIARVTASDHSYFPVVDDRGLMTGIFSLSDLRAVLPGFAAGSPIVAADIATTPVITVVPEDDLHTALQRFTRKNIDELPVVAAGEPGRLLGMLRRKDLIAAYHHEIERLRAE